MTSLTENALTVLQSRYLLRDAEGKGFETPDQLFRRVARHIASAEILFKKDSDILFWENKFYDLMQNLQFLPNSPTLMNAGTFMNQLSACFVLPVKDSIESIFDTLKHTALIQKSGGGTGFNFSHIRPKNDFIETTGGDASGPVSFPKIYDAATENIKQGGKRRGANMGILDISHPDIEEFIASKHTEGALRNFNISVGMTDDFMKAVENNEDWNLINPISGNVSKKVKAKQLWNLIIKSAWQTGDPGLIFLDTINKTNPTPTLGKMESTNPCGEVPLLAYEPCNLGSINLSLMIKNTDAKTEIDWTLLQETIHTSIRFLDNIIEVNDYVLPQIREMAKGNRKIGLGVMGWAELLIKLEISYASEEAVSLGEKMMQFINETGKNASGLLAKERGVFPNWEKSIYSPGQPVRNATRTSIAPTGTISIIANTSSSIEPLFALALSRSNILKGQVLTEVNEIFVKYLKTKNLYSENVIEQVSKNGSISEDTSLPEEAKKLFLTAHEIDYIWHIRHQVAFQKHTDNAVSKTINLHNNALEKDVENAYLTAWKLNAKGITIFRDGSKSSQVLNRGVTELHDIPRTTTCQVCAD
jgi:ribonucleoside-diphosphate reductase alpha chain